jgi:hypothetical protein
MLEASDPAATKACVPSITGLIDSSIFAATSAVEMQLSAAQPLADVHRLVWPTAERSNSSFSSLPDGGIVENANVSDSTVCLTPMQIRTWILRN